MKSNHQASIVFVIVVVMIDTVGFGLIFPVLPQLITQLLHTDMSTAATYGGWLAFAYASMQFIFAPVLGNLSDQYGRRPVILSSLVGFGLDCALLALAPDIIWLFIGRTIAGITGASYSAASACIADISTDENRTKNFGLVNAAFGVGFIIGPVIGGTLGQFGIRTPFMIAALLSLINFIFGYFFFPESLSPANRRKFEWKRASPFGTLKKLREIPFISTLILSMMFVTVANHSMESVWSYFTIVKFHWSSRAIGFSLAFIGAVSILIQLWLVGVLSKLLGDTRMAILGLLLVITGYLMLAFTASVWVLLAAMIIYLIGGIEGTAMQSMMTAAMPDNEQGELQGGLGSLMGLTTLIAPPLMTSSFAYFTGKNAPFFFPGMPFFIAALLTVVSLVLLLIGIKKIKSHKIS